MNSEKVQTAELTNCSKKCKPCRIPRLLSNLNGLSMWKKQNPTILRALSQWKVEGKSWSRLFITDWFSINKTKMGAQQWRNAQESFLSLEKKQCCFCGFHWRNRSKPNPSWTVFFCCIAAVEDVDIANNYLLSSIERQYLILQV